MFFSRSAPEMIRTIEDYHNRPRTEAALQAIKAGKCSIFYSFNPSTGNITYEAVNNEEPSHYARFLLSPKGEILEEGPGNEESTLYLVHALELYIYEFEKALGEKDPARVNSIYEKDLSDMEALLSLTPRQLERRANIRKEFADIFLDSPTSSNDANYDKKVAFHVEWSFTTSASYYGEQNFAVRLTLFDGNERLGIVRSNSAFLKCYEEGGAYALRNTLRILADREDFDRVSADALQFFISKTSFNGQSNFLTEHQLLELLSMLHDEHIYLDEMGYTVGSKTEVAGFRITPKETISIYPKPDSQSIVYYSSTYLAMFSRRDTSCHIFHFPTRVAAKIYSFVFTHTDKDVELVKDLVKKHVDPSLALRAEDGVEAEEDPLRIELYVDLSDKGHLIFRTVCKVNGDEQSMESLRENLYYRNKLNEYTSRLSALGGVVNGNVKEQESIVAFLTSDLTNLKATCYVYLSDALKAISVKKDTRIQVDLSQNQNFLSLAISSPDFDSDTLAEMLSSYKKKKKFILLGNTMVLLDTKEIEEAASLQEEAGLKDALNCDTLPFYDAFLLANKKSSLNLTFSDFVKKAIESISNFESTRLRLSEKLASSLRSYQVAAVKWMHTLSSYGLSGILADDMGLGKTLESIAFLSSYSSKAPCLVLSPKSVTYNWANEVSKWNPDAKVTVLSGGKAERKALISKIKKDKSKGIYVISYDSLRNDIELFEDIEFGVILADEAQFIKNALSKKAKAVKSLNAACRFALTGTPIENSLSDLWSIFDFLMPGYLGSFETFKKNYINLDSTYSREDLLKKITPFLLRRSKSSVLKDLPSKSVETITLAMEDKQAAFYEANLLQAKKQMEEKKDAFSIFPLLTKLREIAVDPSSFYDGFEEPSAKFDYVTSLCQEVNNSDHKVVLFSSFTKVLAHLGEILDEQGIAYSVIEGDTPAQKRVELASSFNDTDEVRVMLVSLKAGGTGLNLVGADIVVHLDPWWNAAAEEQATDRAYRLGQTRPVTVYKLICHNSIEEKVLNLQESKKDLSASLVKEGDALIKKLSADDISYLLS